MNKSDDPIKKFNGWLEEAKQSESSEPTAFSLATAAADGTPSVRMVLLKAVDDAGFVFYTNTESRKGDDLKANPKAALCFHWKSLGRQVRVEGDVLTVTEEEADVYFASRGRDSRIGAWASLQSRPLVGRFDLEKAVAKYVAKYAFGEVPRPPYWSGYRVQPARIEFWQEKPFRLHERLVFSRADANDRKGWRTEYLYP